MRLLTKTFILTSVLASISGSLPAVANVQFTEITSGLPYNVFSNHPVIRNGTVVFLSNGGFVDDGIYSATGGSITPVATTSDLIPGTSHPFVGGVFGRNVVFDGQQVAFFGGNSVEGIEGYFQTHPLHPNVLQTIATEETSYPGSTGSFLLYRTRDIYLDNGSFVFDASDGGCGCGRGIFRAEGGSITTVFESGVDVSIINSSADATSAAIYVREFNGVDEYLVHHNGTAPSTIFHFGSTLPNIGEVGNLIRPPQVRGDEIFVNAHVDNGNGLESTLLHYDGATWHRFVGDNDATPDGLAVYDTITAFAISPDPNDNLIAFVAHDSLGRTGIYAIADGVVSKVIQTGEMLEGQTVDFLGLRPGAVDDRQIAMSVGGNSIYVATLVGTGDFDGDVDYDLADVDALVAEIVAGTHQAAFDLTGDGLVDVSDLDRWRMEAGGYNLGPGLAYLAADANLDGVVDGQDFIAWNGSKFTSGNGWSGADFNADGVTDGQDFIIWNSLKFMSADARDLAPVPEPGCWPTLVVVAALIVFRDQRPRCHVA